MQKKSIKILLCLAIIFAFRIFGLMLILPIISLYADSYLYSNKLLIGICIGSYGLVQSLLQIPIGSLSDRIGRKKTILMGLGLFVLGSIIACYANTIYELILGRVIQGAGAIGSTMLAAVSDYSSVEDRTKAMAFIGIAIGGSFFLSVLISPMIAANFGMQGILQLTLLLSVVAFIVAFVMLPKDIASIKSSSNDSWSLRDYFDKDLGNTYISIWILHLSYTAIFGVVPLVLTNSFSLNISGHSKFYFISLVISLLLSMPAIYFAERAGAMRPIFLLSICSLVISAFVFGSVQDSIYAIYGAMILFFAAFTLLESVLPSLTSRYAIISARGLVMGLFSSFQFLGIFTGGLLVGFMQHYFVSNEIFYVMSVLLFLWLAKSRNIRKPKFTKVDLDIDVSDKGLAWVSTIKGVGEASLIDNKLMLKVDLEICNIEDLRTKLLSLN